MSGRILRAGDPYGASHNCMPPKTWSISPTIGGEEEIVHHPGTVWECDCERRWIAKSRNNPALPPVFKPESRVARWARLARLVEDPGQ